MSTFAFEHMADWHTTLSVYKLKRGERCLVNEFEDEIETDGNLRRQLLKIHAHLQDLANEKIVPKRVKKKIHLKYKKHTVYELRTDNLRYYFFEEHFSGSEKQSMIIIIGGKKTTQEKDIKKIAGIMMDYSNSKTD